MADFTSVQNGNWDDGATWGNTSPGVEGTDFPGAGQSASCFHDIEYDAGDSSTLRGSCIVETGGLLNFPIDSDSTMLFAIAKSLVVRNGGELRVGTSGAPVGKNYHAYFHFKKDSVNRDVFYENNGAYVNIYGDPEFYGSEKYAYLDQDWTAGQTFYIEGDFSSKWQSGQKFFIHQNKLYTLNTADSHIYTINTVGAYDAGNDRTPITITEASPGITFTALHTNSGNKCKLVMMSRNVVFCDPDMPFIIYGHSGYPPKLIHKPYQTAINTRLFFNDVLFYGWYGAFEGYNGYNHNVRGENNVISQTYRGLYRTRNAEIGIDIISCSYGLRTCLSIKLIGDICCGGHALYDSTNIEIVGDLVSIIYGVNLNYAIQLTGDIISCFDGWYYSQKILHKGNIVLCWYGGYENFEIEIIGDILANKYGSYMDRNLNIIGNLKYNTIYGIYKSNKGCVSGEISNNGTDIYLTSGGGKYSCVLENCEVSGVERELRIYQNCGNLLPLKSGETFWQTPPSGLDWELIAFTTSYCNETYAGRLELSPLKQMSAYVEAGVRTLTFKVYANSGGVTSDNLVLEGYYLSEVSGPKREKVTNPVKNFAHSTWEDLSVTFTAGQDGIVYFNLFVKANKSTIIDPQWSIS